MFRRNFIGSVASTVAALTVPATRRRQRRTRLAVPTFDDVRSVLEELRDADRQVEIMNVGPASDEDSERVIGNQIDVRYRLERLVVAIAGPPPAALIVDGAVITYGVSYTDDELNLLVIEPGRVATSS